jgi:quercetin dioxygenase-like cupin family protein
MVVNREVGACSMSVWTTFHQPGEVVPLHTHEYEEIITIIAGEAMVTVAGESIPVHADMSIVIPRVRHTATRTPVMEYCA